MPQTKISIGTRFRATYADSNALWEVRKIRPGAYYDCVIVEDDDWMGYRQIFSAADIRAHLAYAARSKASLDASEDFFAGLQPGQVVHYHHGFGEFIRCEVVTHEGRHQLKPVALVGSWRPLDLTPSSPSVKNVLAGKIFRPHATTIFENPMARTTHNHPNPAEQQPI